MSTFLFNQNQLIENILKLKNSFYNKHQNFKVYYSVKTNYHPFVLDCITKNDCSLEIVSSYEWSLIKDFNLKSIVLNGPSKSQELIQDMLENGVEKIYFNVDNDTDIEVFDQLSDEQKEKIELGIRVYPKKDGIWNRFGFDIDSEKFAQVFDRLKHYISGFHFHFSTNNFDLSNYEIILQKISKLCNDHQITLKYIDIGGGLPGSSELIYHNLMYNQLPELVSKYVDSDTLVISEVGRNLSENIFDLECKIISVKKFHSNNIEITIDTNIMHFPCFWEKKFDIEIIPTLKNANKEIYNVDIFGNSCMQIDKITSNEMTSFEPKVGDKVIIKKVGAYSITQASNFITAIPAVELT